MVPKLVGAATHIMVAIMSSYPQYFVVIAHKTESNIVVNIVDLMKLYNIDAEPWKLLKLSKW